MNHKLLEPTSEHGVRSVVNYMVEEVAECEDCETDEYLTIDDNGWTVCRKCGLVLSEKVLVHSYTKPQINYKTPPWRKPKVYDQKFHDLMEKHTDSNTRFNYTRPGSISHELDGYYNRRTNEVNAEELVLNNECYEQMRLMACSIDTFGRSLYGNDRS